MRKFIVTVNGKSYEVEIEEVKDGVTPRPSSVKPVEAPKLEEPKESPKAAPKVESSEPRPAVNIEGGTNITAPMPGTILDVNVKVGDTVKKGDVLLILEAMKMENEIMAPVDGKVVAVNVDKGVSVKPGELMVVLK